MDFLYRGFFTMMLLHFIGLPLSVVLLGVVLANLEATVSRDAQ